MSFESAYPQGYQKPRVVKQWEAQVAKAETHEDAQTQLLYSLLVQTHKTRVLVAWMLGVMVLVVAASVLSGILITEQLTPDSSTDFGY